MRFCFQCEKYPCKDLRALDKRYREKYHMSMMENLEEIRVEGMEAFLKNQNLKWICPNCGELRCAHNGLCLFCELESYKKIRNTAGIEKRRHKHLKSINGGESCHEPKTGVYLCVETERRSAS